MAIEWPSTVPHKPEARSLVVDEPFRQAKTTEFAGGPFRRRPGSTLVMATVRFSIIMSTAQYETFKSWVRLDLVQGTVVFDMPIWTGSDYAVKACQFRQGYQPTALSGLEWRVQLVLDVEDY